MLNPQPQTEPETAATTSSAKFARGQWVRVKPWDQIQMTLDLDGSFQGLPFMPEMAKLCGKRFRIVRFANQVCANVGTVKIRKLADVVVLKVDRCDGQFHGGCEMGCDLLWKTQWLNIDDHTNEQTEKEPKSSGDHDIAPDFHAFLVQLTSVVNDDVAEKANPCFRCQATELGAASRQSSAFNLQQYRVERETNGTSLSRIGAFLASTVLRKVTKQDGSCEGPCRRTPVSHLNLAVGDKVRVKSFEEIVKTLDANGCNRGLWFDEVEMRPFCGQTLTVSRQITRIIDEGTGELLNLKVPSVVLNESQCSGLSRRFCGRGMLHFWREVWLERAQ